MHTWSAAAHYRLTAGEPSDGPYPTGEQQEVIDRLVGQLVDDPGYRRQHRKGNRDGYARTAFADLADAARGAHPVLAARLVWRVLQGAHASAESTTGPAAFDETMFGTRLPAARVVERVDPLTLDPDELILLDLLGPPHLISTPRAVKRLANSYGLLTALRRDHRAADLADQHATLQDKVTGQVREVTYRPYRAGLVLLGALVAFPALGPALLMHLHRTAHQQPHQPWEHFLTELSPANDSGRWSSPADPAMTRVQAHHWETMLNGLREIAQQATDRGLPLPEPLSAWAAWVVPVGRLSFPAGRIVNTLRSTPPRRSNT